jgi:hypothetical protein
VEHAGGEMEVSTRYRRWGLMHDVGARYRGNWNMSPCYCPQSEFESELLAVRVPIINHSIHNLEKT